jgi:hypothetical protein
LTHFTCPDSNRRSWSALYSMRSSRSSRTQWTTKNRVRNPGDHLLTGLLFDDTGHPMAPTHATKAGIRYRYYVSRRPCLSGKTVADRVVPTSPALSCRGEFGTGFLPPETHAPKGILKTLSLHRDRKSETTNRENWPQKRPLYQRAISCGFRKTAWWRRQSSETGLGRSHPCYSLLFQFFRNN